jgi:hypothetical protein
MVRQVPDLSSSRSRRGMLATVAGLSAGAGLAGVTRVLAQDAAGTPTLPLGQSGGGAGCSAPIGTAAEFKNVEGAVVLRISVSKLTDPFSAYDPSGPPPRGNRYLALSVAVENSGPNPVNFDPGAIFVQDADGFIIRPTGINLGAEPAEPGLVYQEIAPGASVSGLIAYVLVTGIEPLRAFYQPAGDRLLLVADLA